MRDGHPISGLRNPIHNYDSIARKVPHPPIVARQLQNRRLTDPNRILARPIENRPARDSGSRTSALRDSCCSNCQPITDRRMAIPPSEIENTSGVIRDETRWHDSILIKLTEPSWSQEHFRRCSRIRFTRRNRAYQPTLVLIPGGKSYCVLAVNSNRGRTLRMAIGSRQSKEGLQKTPELQIYGPRLPVQKNMEFIVQLAPDFPPVLAPVALRVVTGSQWAYWPV